MIKLTIQNRIFNGWNLRWVTLWIMWRFEKETKEYKDGELFFKDCVIKNMRLHLSDTHWSKLATLVYKYDLREGNSTHT